jgi:SsrA-binding protein
VRRPVDPKQAPKTLVPIMKNRRASFDYEIERKLEAGVSLLGSEVKSLRTGKLDIADAYATVEKGEAWLRQLYIAPFEQAKMFPHEPRRARKLLLSRREIEELEKDIMRGGYTALPIELYFLGGRVKVVIGIGRGKKKSDKRADLVKKTEERETRAELGRIRKGRS